MRKTFGTDAKIAARGRKVIGAGLTPLEYILSVVRDDKASASRRDKMALAAVPYCHAKRTEYSGVSKKMVMLQGNEMATRDSEWAGGLAQ